MRRSAPPSALRRRSRRSVRSRAGRVDHATQGPPDESLDPCVRPRRPLRDSRCVRSDVARGIRCSAVTQPGPCLAGGGMRSSKVWSRARGCPDLDEAGALGTALDVGPMPAEAGQDAAVLTEARRSDGRELLSRSSTSSRWRRPRGHPVHRRSRCSAASARRSTREPTSELGVAVEGPPRRQAQLTPGWR
jgi:hypothetical protein